MQHETIKYPCGCSANGPGPLPRYCPDHQSLTSARIDELIGWIDGIWPLTPSEAKEDVKRALRELQEARKDAALISQLTDWQIAWNRDCRCSCSGCAAFSHKLSKVGRAQLPSA